MAIFCLSGSLNTFPPAQLHGGGVTTPQPSILERQKFATYITMKNTSDSAYIIAALCLILSYQMEGSPFRIMAVVTALSWAIAGAVRQTKELK